MEVVVNCCRMGNKVSQETSATAAKALGCKWAREIRAQSDIRSNGRGAVLHQERPANLIRLIGKWTRTLINTGVLLYN